MRTILKYPLLKTVGQQEVLLPKSALILTCQIQHGELVIWAEVDAQDKIKVPHQIEIVFTGGKILEHGENRYISTCQDDWGLVWHVFEKHNRSL